MKKASLFKRRYNARKSDMNMTNALVAREIDMPLSTFNTRLRDTGLFGYDELKRLFKVLNYSDQDILEVMRSI